MDFTFGCGFLAGIAVAWFAGWMRVRSEWSARRDLERRLAKLERNLCCGAGIFGCKGGPNCTWDHK